MESFGIPQICWVLMDKDIQEFEECRNKNLVFSAWDRMQEAIHNGMEYLPMVDPPLAHLNMALPPKEG